MRKTLTATGVIVGTMLGLGLVVLSKWPRINDVATGKTPQYPDLHAQHFDQSFDVVFDTCEETAKALGLAVVSSDRESGVIEAVATTRIMRFKDDVTITVTREDERVTVNVRSHSRLGKGDFGANAARIRLFQTSLHHRM